VKDSDQIYGLSADLDRS